VVAFAGDGCFLMTVRSSATAVQFDIPLVASSSTRHVRHDSYAPGEPLSEAGLGDRPEESIFAALAKAYGGHGEARRSGPKILPARLSAR